jgi:hypothetical protein
MDRVADTTLNPSTLERQFDPSNPFPTTPVKIPRYTPNMRIEFVPTKGSFIYVDENGKSIPVLGLTRWHLEDETAVCTIYASVPRFVENDPRMEVLGHEFLHCLAGAFHDD